MKEACDSCVNAHEDEGIDLDLMPDILELGQPVISDHNCDHVDEPEIKCDCPCRQE